MSRRKQLKPRHVDADDDELTAPEAVPAPSSEADGASPLQSFPEGPAVEEQDKGCDLNTMALYDHNQMDEELAASSPPDGPPHLESAQEAPEDDLRDERYHEELDMPSSPSVHSDREGAAGSSGIGDERAESPERNSADTNNIDSMGLPDSNVKLESLQNTNVAVAQFAENNDVNSNDLVVLQSTLYHLQQQQLMQLQMLQQLQQQIVMGANPAQIAAQLPPASFLPPGFNPMLLQSVNKNLLNACLQQQQQGQRSDEDSAAMQDDESLDGSSECTTPNPQGADSESKEGGTPGPQEVHMPANVPLNPNTPMLNSDLAKLELFKKGMTPSVPEDNDDHKERSKFTSDDPYSKYKCKYCYKVFSSDSSLQIHIRSHTGERPFKCNVCGNRFTTRGNLKVHFQRHKQDYPNLWMNPNPVPEHLDHLQPPLMPADASDVPRPPLPLLGPMGGHPLPHPLMPPMLRPDIRDDKDSDDGSNSPKPHEDSLQSPSRASSPKPDKSPVAPSSLPFGAPPPLTSLPSSFPPQSMPLPGMLPSMPNPMMPFPFDGSSAPFMQGSILPKKEDPLEEFMECTKSETSKLEALVKNIETKLTDPNQCAICQRILSCKSALQMHYRTHTGERPFKCKICGRAFTTKGNLKTHMGVHRAKPPLRMMHQCPVCHKQFTNALVLQQHIRMHTGELPKHLPPMPPPNDMMMQAAMMQPFPGFPFFPPGGGPGFPPPMHPGMVGGLDMRKTEEDKDGRSKDEENDHLKRHERPDSDDGEDIPAEKRTKLTEERPDSPRNERECESPGQPLEATPPNLVPMKQHEYQSPESVDRPPSLPKSREYDRPDSPASKAAEFSALYGEPSVASSAGNFVPSSYSTSLMALEERVKAIDSMDKSPRIGLSRPLEQIESIIRRTEHDEGRKQSSPDDASPAPFDGNTSFDGGREYPGEMKGLGAMDLSVQGFEATTGKPHTTCDICFKTFACKSALDIHYRSHTRERPYRCDVCDRSFSTRGNMKQHMLTHKIRDLPDQAFDEKKGQTPTEKKHYEGCSSMATPPSSLHESSTKPKSPVAASTPNSHHNPSPFVRKPNLKHVCQVCAKPFSSASALQIHMRTHTGDKPFKCNVCGKAFTTKGNLKVHMGTHMWNNGPSRRGRRMSVEGLPGIPPKELDFYNTFSPHRTPELFPFPFPGLPQGFPPKMNEISVIQSLNGAATHLPPTSAAEAMMGHLSMMKAPLPPDLMHKKELMLKSEERKIKQETNNNTGSNGELDLSIRKTSPAPKTSPTPAATTSPKSQPMPEAASNPTWLWKTTCHLCSKVFPTAAALEYHMKSHMAPPSHPEQASPKPLTA